MKLIAKIYTVIAFLALMTSCFPLKKFFPQKKLHLIYNTQGYRDYDKMSVEEIHIYGNWESLCEKLYDTFRIQKKPDFPDYIRVAYYVFPENQKDTLCIIITPCERIENDFFACLAKTGKGPYGYELVNRMKGYVGGYWLDKKGFMEPVITHDHPKWGTVCVTYHWNGKKFVPQKLLSYDCGVPIPDSLSKEIEKDVMEGSPFDY